MKILYASSFGSDDPTRASFPLIFAKGALEAGHEAIIFLAGEAPYLLKEEVANSVQGVGWPKVADLWQDILAAKIPVYI